MTAANYSRKVYMSVVEDVIANVREAFLDEGVDEQVLQELKQLWESKLTASRAMEPAESEPVIPSNIPYQLMQQSQQHVVPQTSTVHHQIPVPVQINPDGQISNAASMAFGAHQGGVFPQQLQALVNVNPGAITLQQTANGQYIIQALPPGMSQAQLASLPQQTIQAGQLQHGHQLQHGQIQHIQPQGLPQLDGTHDEEAIQADSISTQHTESLASCSHTESLASCSHTESSLPLASCSDTESSLPLASRSPADSSCMLGACGGVEFEIDTSCVNTKKLRRALRPRSKQRVPQLDGNHDSSSSDDDNFDDNDDDNDDEDKDDDGGEEEEPLNSDDDVSEEDPQDLFDTDNVVVCQFEKISRNKNKWKFNLKDGIMNLDGKDHVFQRGTGEAEW